MPVSFDDSKANEEQRCRDVAFRSTAGGRKPATDERGQPATERMSTC